MEILNLVVFPSITYRMNIIYFLPKDGKKWDQMARKLVAFKLKVNQYIESNHWFLPYKWLSEIKCPE